MSDEWVTIDRHLYLTEDGCRVVEEGDTRGRWLHWAPGNRIKRAEYERLFRPEVKQAPLSANKSRRPQGNK